MDATNLANSLFLNQSFKLGTVSMDTISIIGEVRKVDRPTDIKEIYCCGGETAFLSEDEKIIFRFNKCRKKLLAKYKYTCEVITGDESISTLFAKLRKTAEINSMFEGHGFAMASVA